MKHVIGEICMLQNGHIVLIHRTDNCVIDDKYQLRIVVIKIPHMTGISAQASNELCQIVEQLYCSPQLLRGQVERPTQACDIYSFAIVLHEMVVNQGPFGLRGETAGKSCVSCTLP